VLVLLRSNRCQLALLLDCGNATCAAAAPASMHNSLSRVLHEHGCNSSSKYQLHDLQSVDTSLLVVLHYSEMARSIASVYATLN
jgi:hypothetical protein